MKPAITKKEYLIIFSLWALGLGLWLFLLWFNQPPFVPGYQHGHDRMVLDAGGVPLATIRHPARRSLNWLENIPPLLRAAALAAEDKRFYEHWGIDWLALGRAMKQNIMAGRVVSGASTITMQLARLEADSQGGRGYMRKIKEAGRALWLEAHYSKEEILTWYLNLAPFGGPLVGIDAGSYFLLGKTPENLSAAEAATLMSLPQDPARFLLTSERARLLKRRNFILERMALAGAINQSELTRALREPLYVQQPPEPLLSAPHFVQALNTRLGEDAPAVIPTYLTPRWQTQISYMVRALCANMRHLDLEQAAVVVLRNRDRAVMAWVGGPDFYAPEDGQVDGVKSLRQPGSALKPFVYALALEEGSWLARPMDDSPLVVAGGDGAFRPRDYDGNFRGRVSMRQALASSLNVPAIRLAMELSPNSVLDMLRALGFSLPESAEHYGPGLALGNGEVSLLALTNAYATLAEGGIYKPVRMWQGEEDVPARRAIDNKSASLITDVLADDESREMGFGRYSVLMLPFPAAVKTGTSQHHRDNWCVGYTSDYTVGVWAGNFSGKPMHQVSGVSGAAPLWRQVMLLLYHGGAGRLPLTAAGISRVKVCVASGLSPGPQCRLLSEELVARPLPLCDIHQEEARNTGGLSLSMPAADGTYILDPDIPLANQAFYCRLGGVLPDKDITWTHDGRVLASGEERNLRLPLAPGRHNLLVEQDGRRLSVNYRVLEPGQAILEIEE